MRSIKRASSKKRMQYLSLLILLLCLSIGYAYLSESLKINSSANVGKMTWDVHFENIIVREGSVNGTATIESDKTTILTSLDLNKPGDYYEFYVDIVNSGSLDAKLDSLVKTVLTTEQKKYLNYTITYKDYVEVKPNDLLVAGAKDTIRILIEVKEIVDSSLLPSSAFHLDIEGKFNYVQDDGEGVSRGNNSLYNQIEKETQVDIGIDFGAISSDTNGLGVYTLSKTSNKAHPVYYYRGAVAINNVIFGGFCWKIIRTTSTGGIKLIYNGTPTDGVCNNIGDATEIGKSAFNTEQNDPRYVGYMYDNNTKDSIIKGVIDTWFSNNLLDYQDYLEDTPFYNERDYTTEGTFPLTYLPGWRVWGNIWKPDYTENVEQTTIKLGATNKEDIFTVGSDTGNGTLTYPVGLITSDEIILAGGSGLSTKPEEKRVYYLFTESSYWSMSPKDVSLEVDKQLNLPRIIIVKENGGMNSSWPKEQGVRPVISLQSTTTYLSGDGTSNSPYIITN